MTSAGREGATPMTAPGRDEIPEDLQSRYDHAKEWLARNQGRVCPEAHDNFIRIELIERIASLTRENRELRELADQCAAWFEDEAQERRASGFDDTSTYLRAVVQLGAKARAALAQKEAV